MIQEVIGLPLHSPPAWECGFATFGAFVLIGIIPLLPYLINFATHGANPAFPISIAITGIAFFCVGALKRRFVEQHWLAIGAETLVVGGSSATLAFAIGFLLSGIA